MARARRTAMEIGSPALPVEYDPREVAILEVLPDEVSAVGDTIARQLVEFADEAAKAVEAAGKLVVTDQASYNMATDVAASIRRVMVKIDPARKVYTGPLDKAKKRLVELFERPEDQMESALDAIRRKMTTWKQAEEARLREAAELQRAAEAIEAKRLADAAAAMGDKSGAAQIAAEAEERAAAPIVIKVAGTGSFGGKAVDVKRPVGTVTDKRQFIAWALNSASAEAIGVLNSIDFGKLALNALAKNILSEGAAPTSVPGFVAEYDTNTTFR